MLHTTTNQTSIISPKTRLSHKRSFFFFFFHFIHFFLLHNDFFIFTYFSASHLSKSFCSLNSHLFACVTFMASIYRHLHVVIQITPWGSFFLHWMTLLSKSRHWHHWRIFLYFSFFFYFFSHLFFVAVVNKNLHTFQSGIPMFEPTRDGVIYFIIFINFLSYLTPIILRHVLKTIQHLH